MKKILLASAALFALWSGVAAASALIDSHPAAFSAGPAHDMQLARNGSDDGAGHDANDDHGGASGSDDDGDDDSSDDDSGSSTNSGCDSAQDQAEKAGCNG